MSEIKFLQDNKGYKIVAGLVASTAISSLVGYAIYKIVKKKTGDEDKARGWGIGTGLGTFFTPSPLKLIWMAGTTAYVAANI